MEEESSTERFLRLMNEHNEKIAAQDKEKKNATKSDSVREQRQEERREKYGQLRAREHPGKLLK